MADYTEKPASTYQPDIAAANSIGRDSGAAPASRMMGVDDNIDTTIKGADPMVAGKSIRPKPVVDVN